ncbi:MAG: glyoxalase [Planctomycetes bacterium]|nr:glyoxalase [Planctomycetota bacterium]
MAASCKGFHHITAVVRSLDRAHWFYSDVLGLPELQRPKFNVPGKWYRCGNSELHVVATDELIVESMRHFAIEVENFAQVVNRLKEKGVQILGQPDLRPDGSHFVFCMDPDGNLVEITQH